MSPPLLAQQPSETRPGFRPDDALDPQSFDNVNVFNGDPRASIPLGPAYPLGPTNSFQLRAHYSAKFWRFDRSCAQDTTGTVRHAYIYGYPTLGAGWTLELGYVTPGTAFEQAAYVSPDGGRHAFYGTPYETTDGTNLRITKPSSNAYMVEFSDGTIHRFEQLYNRPKPVPLGSSYDFTDLEWDTMAGQSGEPKRYGLTNIENRFNTTLLSVSYMTGAKEWRVSSITLNPGTSQARSIGYVWKTQTVGGITWQVLDHLTLPTASDNLTATFTYSDGIFQRNGFDNSVGGPLCNNPSGDVFVPLLGSLVLSGGAASQTHTFTYYLTPETQGRYRGGVLTAVTLPTKGIIQYEYLRAAVTCYVAGCEDPETGQLFGGSSPEKEFPDYSLYWDNSAAVAQRTETDPYTGLSAVVTYDRYQHVPLTPAFIPDDLEVTRRTVVTAPSGNPGSPLLATRHVFHTEIYPSLQGGGVELARRYYQDGNAAGAPIRTVVNCHRSDNSSSTGYGCGYRGAGGGIQPYELTTNVRLESTVTWYGVNPTGGGSCSSGYGTECTATTNSGYDPIARKYDTTLITSTLQPSGWLRSTTTDWLPSSGYWLLDLFASRFTFEIGSAAPTSSTTNYTFDQATGFLQQSSTSDGGKRHADAERYPGRLGEPSDHDDQRHQRSQRHVHRQPHVFPRPTRHDATLGDLMEIRGPHA